MIQSTSILQTDRFVPTYDSLEGTLLPQSSINTSIFAIRDTGFFLEWFKPLEVSSIQRLFHFPHTRKLDTPLASIHLRYSTSTAPIVGDTVSFSGIYCWQNPCTVAHAAIEWTTFTSTLTFTDEGAWYYGIHSCITQIPFQGLEEYDSVLRLILYRNGNSDTYTGHIGILGVCGLTHIDRLGSFYERTDTI